MKIAIVKNAGNGRATQIMGGVYGSMTADESGNARFKIAPEFTRVSYLFSLLEDGSAPVSLGDVDEIEVEDRDATTTKANLMHALSLRWESMYAQAGAGASNDHMASAMLATERVRVSSNVRQHLAAMGMSAYEVAYDVEGESYLGSTDIADRSQLLRTMQPTNMDTLRFTGVTRLDDIPRAHQALEHGMNREGENLNADAPREWHFEGRKAAGTIQASITVVALNEDGARRVASQVLGVSERALGQTHEATAVETPRAENDANIANNRDVNSVRENSMFGLLTSKLHTVDNLHAGSEMNYAEAMEDEDSDEYDERERE